MATHIVTILSSLNGRTLPEAGQHEVPDGADFLVQFIPFADYRVSGISVDGAPVGVGTSHMLTGVHADTTIGATFLLAHYEAISNYSLSNLSVPRTLSPQYKGIRLSAEVSTPSLPSHAVISLSNPSRNVLSFSWEPGWATLAYVTGAGQGGHHVKVPCGLGPYRLQLRIKGSLVEADLRGTDGVQAHLLGELSYTDASEITTGWVVTIGSSATEAGLGETVVSGYTISADTVTGTLGVDTPYVEAISKRMMVLAL